MNRPKPHSALCAAALFLIAAGAAPAQVNFNKAKQLAREAVDQANQASGQQPPAPVQTQPAPPEKKEMTVDEIVRRANYVAYYQGKDGRAQVRMTIVDEQKQK